MATKMYENQPDTASFVSEPIGVYQRTSGIKKQIMSDMRVGIQALKAEERGEYVKFGSLDDLIVELESGR